MRQFPRHLLYILHMHQQHLVSERGGKTHETSQKNKNPQSTLESSFFTWFMVRDLLNALA